MLKFHGTGVAMITPFNDDFSIDYLGLRKVIDHVISGKADYLVVQGTTGETATLTKQEKREVLKATLEHNAGRVPIVYGMGSNSTQALLDEIKETDFTGIDAVLSVSPYYNKPSQAGIIAHYTTFADACPVPVILYNVPGRTMSNLTYQTTITLSAHPNIIGIKEASGDLSQCMRIAAKMPEDFLLISGDDILTPSMRVLGGQGVISVLANAYPEIFYTICHADLESSKKAAFRLLDINPMMYEESNPVGLKYLMELLGICGQTVRLPLVSGTESLKQRIKEAAVLV
jgi:4-hydroxy-tetrahydrodipicolinate synthase